MASPDDREQHAGTRFAVGSERTRPWLGIIGIGEDGVEGLGTPARTWIEKSEQVFGSSRQLALAAPLIRGHAIQWPSPFPRELEEVFAARGRPITVLASGDPFHFGIGPLLAAKSDPGERFVAPGISSFSLAAARLGWSLQNTRLVSAHGRSLDAVCEQLSPGARLLVLTSDASTPVELARTLSDSGYGRSTLHVLERLGGPSERVRASLAQDFDLSEIDPLQIVGVSCTSNPLPQPPHGPRALATPLPSGLVAGLAPGLLDECFEHDGQLTKRDVRSLTLARLAPVAGERLWDIGAGCGSIAIEWLRLDPSLRACAVEVREDRVARIRRNAERLGVSHLSVTQGHAPDALRTLPRPDAVFVGGGASAEVFDAARSRLPRGGRLVANAVTLETEDLLRRCHAQFGGDLVQVALAHAEPLGRFQAWRPARPIVLWSWVSR